MVKNLPAMQETRVKLLEELQEDPPEEANGNPLQYSCLENSMDRRAWRATVYGDAKSQTQLSNLAQICKHAHKHPRVCVCVCVCAHTLHRVTTYS